jgi:hypothetical protein
MGSLTVHVLDARQKPVRGKKVYCNFVGSHFGLSDTSREKYTDDEGGAEFDDVPVGEVEVIVNGEKQLSISIGQNDHEVVTVTI